MFWVLGSYYNYSYLYRNIYIYIYIYSSIYIYIYAFFPGSTPKPGRDSGASLAPAPAKRRAAFAQAARESLVAWQERQGLGFRVSGLGFRV